MFFVPLFGAAVAGRETEPNGAKRGMVSLPGPGPGILIGTITGIIYFRTGWPILADATRTLLFLNTFDLLPLHPLDGGRLFDAVLWTRRPWIELSFKLIAAWVLAWVAFTVKDRFLGARAFLVLITLRGSHTSAPIAREIKSTMNSGEIPLREEIPELYLSRMVIRLKEKIPVRQWRPKLFATYAAGIWERARDRPCTIAAGTGLILCNVLLLCLGIGSLIVFEGIVHSRATRPGEVMNGSVNTPISSDMIAG